MNPGQIFSLVLVASLPIAVLVVIGRHFLSLYRSIRARRYKYVLYSVLSVAAMLVIFAGVAFVWFGYAVGHGAKPVSEGLILIALSMVPIYGGGYAVWRLAYVMDSRTGDAETNIR